MPISERRIFFDNRVTLRQSSHIEYYLQCEWCTHHFWGRKKDAKFCSRSCCQLSYVANKKKSN